MWINSVFSYKRTANRAGTLGGIVDSSTKCFVVRRQCNENLFLGFRCKPRRFSVVHNYMQVNSTRLHCCVSTATMVTRKRNSVPLYIHIPFVCYKLTVFSGFKKIVTLFLSGNFVQQSGDETRTCAQFLFGLNFLLVAERGWVFFMVLIFPTTHSAAASTSSVSRSGCSWSYTTALSSP